MAWDIRVWHDEQDGRVRLVIEAGGDVPDEVISSVAGSYWLEEVQFVAEWDDAVDAGPGESGPRMHG